MRRFTLSALPPWARALGRAGVLSLLFAGCNDNGLAPVGTGAPPAPTLGKHTGALVFSADESPPPAEPFFVIREVVDLTVTIAWQGANPQGRTTKLRFYSPSGRLFFERLLKDAGGDVRTTLPVGGTLISRRSLAGTWRAEAELDDGSLVRGRFHLDP